MTIIGTILKVNTSKNTMLSIMEGGEGNKGIF